MIRRIIKIDEDKCNGCGVCATACHEGAIEMLNGKAHLTREDCCDGLGDCLPTCPVGAITFEEREASSYDESAACAGKQKKQLEKSLRTCAGTQARTFRRDEGPLMTKGYSVSSQLIQWPCQIKLVPTRAPYFDGADLLIAADCTAYAYGNFHDAFMRNHITLIGCPKLDEGDYAQKLTEILQNNSIRSLRIVRMEVPCCGGLENAVKRALRASGKLIPCQLITITTDGKIIE